MTASPTRERVKSIRAKTMMTIYLRMKMTSYIWTMRC